VRNYSTLLIFAFFFLSSFRFRKFIAVIFDNRQITSISYKGNNNIAVSQTLAASKKQTKMKNQKKFTRRNWLQLGVSVQTKVE